MRVNHLLLTLLFFALASCTPFLPVDFPMSSQESPCNEQTPIVFMHGNLASGDTYSLQFQRFEQNGYCPDRLFAFDWNSIGFEANKQKLTQFIFEVLRETGAEKVHLVGHSAGSYLGYDFLKQQLRADLVDKYVHLAGEGYSQPAGPQGSIPTLNLWSTYDFVVPGGNMPGAVNVVYDDADHFEVASGAEAFEAMYLFLAGHPPASSQIFPTDQRTISGKAVSLGENIPAEGSTIEIWPVDPADGTRQVAEPVATFIADRYGFWGPFEADAGVYYEFLVSSDRPGDRPIHYYTEPFIRSNRLLYLRSYPPPNSLASYLVNVIPEDDDMAVSAAFSANRSIITGRDDLTVDGLQLATPEFASPEQFAVAIFLFDDNDNGATDFYLVPAFEAVGTIGGVDFYKDATVPGTTEFYYNGRPLRVPNWKSESEGVSIALFN